MNNDRQKILTDYISYLYTTGRTYDTVGKYIKYVEKPLNFDPFGHARFAHLFVLYD